LADRLRLPLTARLDYLDRYAASYPEWAPWLVGVSEVDGAWRAGALLMRRRRGGLTRVTGLGAPVCDHGRLPALDDAAAAALVEAIAAGLAATAGPWVLRLEQLPAGDPVAARLADRLPHARLVPGTGMPRIDIGADRRPRAYLSKKYLQQVNASRRRFGAAGVEPRLVQLHAADEIEPLLPALLAIRRSRDRTAFYRPELEDGRRAAWWQDILLRFARRGQLELNLVDVGAERPAGYLAAVLDGATYRCWDGRMSPVWDYERPGHFLFGELLRRVFADERWAEVDYLRGEGAYKLRMANDVVRTSHLLAWSSRSAELLTETPPAALRRLHDWKSAHPGVDRALRAVRRRWAGRYVATGVAD
jgi:hypothetical protein